MPASNAARWTVEIEPGVYNERVRTPARLGPVTLRGIGHPETVVLRHACPGGDGSSGAPGCAPCPPLNDSDSGMRPYVYTLMVSADDFAAENLAVANDACGYDAALAGQSEAPQVLGDRAAFNHAAHGRGSRRAAPAKAPTAPAAPSSSRS